MSNGSGAEYKLLHRTQWIFLVVSIIPMVVLAYLCVWHLFPALGKGQATLVNSIYVILGLTILLSVLGYIVSRKTALGTIETISENNHRLTKLLGLVNRMNLTTDEVKVEQEAVRAAARIIDADAVLLYLMDNGELVCRHSTGVQLTRGEQLTCVPGSGPAGLAARSRQVVQLDASEKTDVPAGRPQALSDLQGGPALAIPQFFQNELFGVLELLRNPGGRPFSTERRQMAEILSQSVAATITSARFHTSQLNFSAHTIELLRLAMDSHIVWKGHLQNVTRYTSLIGRRLDLGEEARREIHFAAILHDIGLLKLRIEGRLLDQQKCPELYQEHPVLGAELVKPILAWKHVAPMIRHHHEFCDGSGYPDGLTKDQTPLGSRIIGVTEAFDAMVNPHSYAETRSPAEALAELDRYSGTRYDERVIGALKEVLELEED